MEKQLTTRAYAGLHIRKLVRKNPARTGTKRHAKLDVLLHSKTVEDAYATAGKCGRSKVFVRSRDVRYAVEHGLIELK